MSIKPLPVASALQTPPRPTPRGVTVDRFLTRAQALPSSQVRISAAAQAAAARTGSESGATRPSSHGGFTVHRLLSIAELTWKRMRQCG